ncbi:MAG TPA: hypothetical protein VK536_08130 [Candidatus Limnocylindrales bacterium]|nr:hypothetical protein [Candidatus Limnocylindrales bacterium]
MPARKIRVEVIDNDGGRYTIAFDGQVTRDKALKLLDIVELLGGAPGEDPTSSSGYPLTSVALSRFDKVQSVVQKSFPLIWFSSKDIQSAYEQELKEPISLSTVSTYLSRMTSKGILLRTGGSNNLKYKTVPSVSQAVIKQSIK